MVVVVVVVVVVSSHNLLIWMMRLDLRLKYCGKAPRPELPPFLDRVVLHSRLRLCDGPSFYSSALHVTPGHAGSIMMAAAHAQRLS